MGIKATATNPEEARDLFNKYADILDMYANDQIASLRWPGGKREKEIKAKLYREIAEEMRSIQFEKE